MIATINGKRYRIQFSYRFGYGGKPINERFRGISACAIVQDGEPFIVSVGSAVCSLSDQWSRREGS